MFDGCIDSLLRPACWFVALALLTTVAQAQVAPGGENRHRGVARARGARGAGKPVATYQQANMTYHGGTVLPDTTIYSIWWGKPGDFPPDAVDGLTTFLKGIDGSNYLGLANQYLFGSQAHTRFGGNFFDPSAPPTTDPFPLDISAAQQTAEVCKIAAANGLKSPTHIFMLYASNFPGQSEGYCAFHEWDTCSDGTRIHYGYMPNTQDYEVCKVDGLDPFLSPNDYSVATRDLANMTAHELLETITDPNGDAWYDDVAFDEVGDACDWAFLTWVPLDETGWKLQTIWSNQIRGCAQGGNHDVRILGALASSASARTFDIPAARMGTFGNSVNGLGAIAGGYIDASNIGHGFIRDPSGDLATFDVPGAVWGTYSFGVNEAGVICGNFGDSNGVHGFVRDPRGHFTAFDAPGNAGGWTQAVAINQSGAITGLYLDAGGVPHGYVRDPSGNFVTFDVPGAGAPYLLDLTVEGINQAGDVTGYYTDSKALNHGFVRSASGHIATFDAPGGTGGTFARSINDQGAIAGSYIDARNVNHGFVRDAQGHFTTFDAPANSINAYGVTAGYSIVPAP